MDNEKKKKRKQIIIAVVIISIIVIIAVIVIVVILLLRRRSSYRVGGAIDCTADADCVLGFRCNTSNGVCSQCLEDADCRVGKVCNGVICLECVDDADCEARVPGQVCDSSKCVKKCTLLDQTCPSGKQCDLGTLTCVPQCVGSGDCDAGATCVSGGCVCAVPVLTEALVAGTGQWPLKLRVSFVPEGDTSGMLYRATFRGENGLVVGTPFATSGPVVITLPTTCDGPYSGYGCSNCSGSGHTVKGTIEAQIQNRCGTNSAVLVIPVSGNCDMCDQAVCQ